MQGHSNGSEQRLDSSLIYSMKITSQIILSDSGTSIWHGMSTNGFNLEVKHERSQSLSVGGSFLAEWNFRTANIQAKQNMATCHRCIFERGQGVHRLARRRMSARGVRARFRMETAWDWSYWHFTCLCLWGRIDKRQR